VTVDPLPMVEASVNGAEPATFFLDTGATLGFSADTARKAGLRAVATIQAGSPGHVTTLYLGVVESLRLGGIELRNVPVSWGDLPMPAPPGGAPAAGAIGTTVFYHFLTTMDYANRALVLRRKSAAPPARRPGASVLPLWLAGDHFPFTLGSLNGYGPRVVSMDTGGSRIGVVTTEEIAARAGIAVDHDHPVLFNGVFTCYPIAPDTISLGHAVGRKVPGLAGPHQLMLGDRVRFDTIANVTHEFFKPFAITFDFVTMTFTITSCTS
jgi:predicted aspartyl protease